MTTTKRPETGTEQKQPPMEHKNVPKITGGRIKPAEYERIVYVATVEHGVTRENILTPNFWELVAIDLRPYNRIEVRTDDGSFFGEYLVLNCDKTWAILHELSYHDLSDVDSSHPRSSDIKVVWKGPHMKWCIVRGSSVVKSQLQTETEAQKEAVSYMDKVA